MSKYIVLKKESVSSIKDLEDYKYFIVHAISEFRIYNKKEFLENYTNLDKIINLYCIADNEELRFNFRNWVKVKILESHEEVPEDAFEVRHVEKKEFIAIKENSTDNYPIVVYKYFIEIEPETVTSGSAAKEIFYLKDIPIIYRHGIRGKNGEK